MKIDLLHNKIIKDTATDAFISSFESTLLPKLTAKYSANIEAVQMYEDHLADGFVTEGEFYYPLTVLSDGCAFCEWIKWNVSEPRDFADGIPYSYIGEGTVDISLAEEVPLEFRERVGENPGYFEGGCVVLKIQSVSEDKTFLAGKYSQRFIDEMARQLSRRIEDAFSVDGIENGGVELLLVFAPGTYMEHVSENVTYRRLLMSARGCTARDFWIKWTPKRSALPLTVSDSVTSSDVVFEIAEDVSHKIREKEYRFLVRTSADKYQAAMGRKNITEWRDLIKRVIKRGELTKIEPKLIASESERELSYKLLELVSGEMAEPVNTEPLDSTPEPDNSDLTALLKTVLGDNGDSEEGEALEPEDVSENFEDKPEPDPVAALFVAASGLKETESEEEIAEKSIEITDESKEAAETEENENSETVSLDRKITEEYDELSEEGIGSAEEKDTGASDCADEAEKLRLDIEREIREKIALEAKIKADEESVYLRRVHDELRRENERLAELAKKAEADKLQLLAEREAEIEKYKQELEARERMEAIEKERLAEAARLAVIEQKRLMEEARANEEKRAAEEEARRIEEARIREEKLREEERRKIEAERAAILEAERVREEREAEAKRTASAEMAEDPIASDAPAKNYTYTSKNARLLFKRPVDPNVTKRIHEIILTTIKYFHKENVYIKIKATVPDSTTVNLHFVKIPEEETELLIQIIKVLGKSDLGITKVFLE